MGVIAQTPVNVKLMGQTKTDNKIRPEICAVAVTQGNWVYKDTNGYYDLGNANTIETRTIAGMVMTPAIAYGPFVLCYGGPVNPGAAMTENQEYVMADTAGGMMLSSDLTAGQYYTRLGAGRTDENGVVVLDIDLYVGGVQP